MVKTRLRRIREDRGLSQVGLAALVPGLNQQRISRAERTLAPRRISAGTAIALATALDIPPAEILNDPLTV